MIWCPTASALTIIIDFNDPGQANTFDIFGNEVSTFSATGFGFVEADREMIYSAVLATIEQHYFGIPETLTSPNSTPLPVGQILDLNFEVGDIGTAPLNGDPEYYFMHIGTDEGGNTFLGQAGVNRVRSSTGLGPNFGFPNGGVFGTTLSDNVNGLGGVGTNLTGGNINPTRHALAGTSSHEIGHALSLLHINKTSGTPVTTPNNTPPLMGTGAIDLPNADRISAREFSITGVNNQNGGATQTHIQQLINAVGTRARTVGPLAEVGTAGVVFNASSLSALLNGTGSEVGDALITSYDWSTGGGAVTGSGQYGHLVNLDIEESGLTDSGDTDTLTLTLTDGDGQNDNDTAPLSYTNATPLVNTVPTGIQSGGAGGSVNFSGLLSDVDLAVNTLIADFESLTWEFDSTTAVSVGGIGDGFLTGTGTSTTGSVLFSTLLGEYGSAGTHTAFLNFYDNGDAFDSQSFSFSFDSAAQAGVPEPSSLALVALGAIFLRVRRRKVALK